MAFTRSDWQAVIDHINGLITSNSLSAKPLPAAPTNHKWSVQDITEARNKLAEISNGQVQFVAPLVKWSQVIIDELMQTFTLTKAWYWIEVYRVNGVGFTLWPATGRGNEYNSWWRRYQLADGGYAHSAATAQFWPTEAAASTYIASQPQSYNGWQYCTPPVEWEWITSSKFNQYKQAYDGGIAYGQYGYDIYTYAIHSVQSATKPGLMLAYSSAFF